MNRFNQCHIEGTLAATPEIKMLKNRAKSITLRILTAEDPDDADYIAHRRVGQEVKVDMYANEHADLSTVMSLSAGDEVVCDCWVESYTFQKNGQSITGQSLATSAALVHVRKPDDGVAPGDYADAPSGEDFVSDAEIDAMVGEYDDETPW